MTVQTILARLLHDSVDLPWSAIVTIKVTLLLVLVWIAHVTFARANPRFRVLLWRCSTVCLLAAPFFSAVLPVLQAPIAVPPVVAAVTKPSNAFLERTTKRTTNDGDRESLRLGIAGSTAFVKDAESPRDHAAPSPAIPHLTDGQRVHGVDLTVTSDGSSLCNVLMIVWALGVIAGGIRFAVCCWRARSLANGYPAASPRLSRLAEATAFSIGVKRPPQVKESPAGVSPCVIGVLRPTLLMSSAWIDVEKKPTGQPGDQEVATGILAHELAHLRSADPVWRVVIHLTSILYWFHPLVWRMGSVHTTACEFAADAVSAVFLGHARKYARALARVALSVRHPSLAGTIAMARRSEISKRLDVLKLGSINRPYGRRAAFPFAIGVFACAAILGGIHFAHGRPFDLQPASPDTPKNSAQEPKATSARRMRVQIVDEQGKLIPKAVLNVRIGNQRDDHRSDQEGVVSFDLPRKEPRLIELWAKAPGHVWMRARWRGGEKKDAVPSEFVFRLKRGTKIGGIVVDENGKPISNVDVGVMAEGPLQPNRRAQSSISGIIATTDAMGKWRCDNMPMSIRKLRVTARHPDYVRDRVTRVLRESEIRKLRALTYSRILEKGVTVEGTIIGPDNTPVKDAVILLGSSPFASNAVKVKPRTDEQGRYRLTNCRRGQTEITVVAKGLAPDLRLVEIRPELGPVNFALKRGGTIRVRVVDRTGKPIPAANVVPDKWRGARSLMGVYSTMFPHKTDENGRLVWNWAPADPIEFDIYGRGYMRLREQVLTPRKDEYVLTLPPVLKITGRVLDAKTKKVVPRFRIVPGSGSESGRQSWQRRETKSGVNGRYEFETETPYPTRYLRIEADGYQAAVSRPFRIDEGSVEFDFELQTGNGPTGVVQSPDGEPLAQAQVVMCLPRNGPYVRNGATIDKDNVLTVRTDEQGRFTFPPQNDPFALLVFSEQGFARVGEAKLKASQTIQVQPWARVEGRLMIGAKPGVNERISLQFQQRTGGGAPQMYFDYNATTDETGRFTFERVPPDVEAEVVRNIILRRAGNGFTSGSTHGVPALIAPGRTDKVTLGGNGRPVIGMVSVPNDFSGKIKDWNVGFHWVKRKQTPSDGPLPDFARPRPTTYSFRIDPGGKFRIEDVPPGDYELHIQVHQPEYRNGHWMTGKRIGAIVQPFTVDPIPAGRSDTPQDLGRLTLEIK